MVKNLFARLRIQIPYSKFRSMQNYELIEFSIYFYSIFEQHYEFIHVSRTVLSFGFPLRWRAPWPGPTKKFVYSNGALLMLMKVNWMTPTQDYSIYRLTHSDSSKFLGEKYCILVAI
jgi:hypothetical protein